MFESRIPAIIEKSNLKIKIAGKTFFLFKRHDFEPRIPQNVKQGITTFLKPTYVNLLTNFVYATH